MRVEKAGRRCRRRDRSGGRRGDDRGQPSPGRHRPAGRTSTGSASKPPASSTSRAASWSTRACAPPTGGSTRSATSRAAPQFTHVANYHAGIVIRNALFRLPAKANDDVIPRVTYTDPELAHVGLTEDAGARAPRRSACCAGRSTTTTARRPSARRAGTSRWSRRRAAHPRRHHRRRACRRTDHHLDAGDRAGAQYPRHGRADRALSDPGGDRKTRRDQLFYAEFDEPIVRRIIGFLRRFG